MSRSAAYIATKLLKHIMLGAKIDSGRIVFHHPLYNVIKKKKVVRTCFMIVVSGIYKLLV